MRSSASIAFLCIASTLAFSPTSSSTPKGLMPQQSSYRKTSHVSLILSKIRTSLSSTTNDIEFDWRTVAKDLFQKDKRPIILFDGVCNLCNGGVNFALDNDSVGNFRFASLQSKAGQSLLKRCGKKADDISSIVLVTPKKAYFKSDAVLRIAAKLDGNPILPLAGYFGPIVPGFIRNRVYDVVADNRYRFGQTDQCRLDFDDEFGGRFVADEL